MENLTINGISTDGPAHCEAMGLAIVFEAYACECVRETIMEGGVGFNPNSGYVYIALENGVSVCSMLGRQVEYLVTNYENGEEYFFNTYDEAISFDIHQDLNFENED
jgi:hypothetical protein